LTGCENGPSGPSERAPARLLHPLAGVRFQQNDAAIACPQHPTRGHGFRVAFDWQDVTGATEYQLIYSHESALLPMINRSVPLSAFESTQCATFVADGNLDGWTWSVGAVVPVAGGQRDTLWSESRENGFMPCRLTDGSRCGT
ncbi:MAG: hypothetical protein ACRENP_27400, partial [Longimicrobiales bacterium]